MGGPSVDKTSTGRRDRLASESTQPELETIFWSGMQLLGFEHLPAGTTAELGPTMFRRSNSNGLDLVLHFLLEVNLGSERLRRDLKGCWPPADGRQRNEWRRVAKGHLELLAEEGAVPQRLVASSASLLHTASGTKLLQRPNYARCDGSLW